MKGIHQQLSQIFTGQEGNDDLVHAHLFGKLVVLDSNSGAIVTTEPAASMLDDAACGGAHERVYSPGTDFLDIFQARDSAPYELVGHIPTVFRAKTGVLVPELNRYYLGVPHHEKAVAELRIDEVQP